MNEGTLRTYTCSCLDFSNLIRRMTGCQIFPNRAIINMGDVPFIMCVFRLLSLTSNYVLPFALIASAGFFHVYINLDEPLKRPAIFDCPKLEETNKKMTLEGHRTGIKGSMLQLSGTICMQGNMLITTAANKLCIYC